MQVWRSVKASDNIKSTVSDWNQVTYNFILNGVPPDQIVHEG